MRYNKVRDLHSNLFILIPNDDWFKAQAIKFTF